MDNIKQFSLYAAKIFKELYDCFPVPVSIDRNKMISDCLLFDKNDELKELKVKKDMADLLIDIDHNGQKRNIEKKIAPIQERYSELENEKRNEIKNQTTIFDNTLNFLASEGLIHVPEGGGYVLTAKAFSHLNKKFENGVLDDEESSYIKTIKSIFSRSAGATEKIGIGLAVKVIPSLLGIS